MSKKDFIGGNANPHDENDGNQPDGQKNLIFFWIAVGCFAAGIVLLALAFTIKNAGTALLIASMFAELACATFLNAQKKKYDFLWVKIARVACYIVMGAALAVFIMGTVAAAN